MAILHFKTLLSVLQKRFLTTPATTSQSSSSSFTVNYLMNSCGLPLKSALSASQKFQLDEKKLQKHDSVINFLKSYGFDDTHIAKLVQKYPKILQCRVHNNLKLKFECLMENGFVGQLLPEFIVRNPFVLDKSLSSHLKPSFDFLKTYLGTTENVVTAIQRWSWLVFSHPKRALPNMDFLIKEGLPVSSISKLVVLRPRVIMINVDRMVYSVDNIKKLGIEPSAPRFLRALQAMGGMSKSTWNMKVEVFKSLGWSEEDVISTFKREPLCFTCSVEKLRRVMDFYVNTVKLQRELIIASPKLVMYAIDKRLRPRYNVLKALESKNLLKDKSIALSLYSSLGQSEKIFRKRFVLKHLDKMPELMEIYVGSSATKEMA